MLRSDGMLTANELKVRCAVPLGYMVLRNYDFLKSVLEL